MSLIAVEVADGLNDAELLKFVVHLAPITVQRQVGECLCGFDMWERLETGELRHTWSAGGGFVGAEFEHQPCVECGHRRDALEPIPMVEGTHAPLFTA